MVMVGVVAAGGGGGGGGACQLFLSALNTEFTLFKSRFIC